MITPPDQPLHDAMRRADVGWLAGHLDARLCSPAVLGRLVRHEDPRVRHLGLVLLAERVGSGRTGDPSENAELAGLLPESVQGPPEEALVLARLHERLGPYRQGLRKPSWRTAGLPARVRIAWLRAELLNEPAVIRSEPRGELLYQAVREVTVTCAHRPERLVDELVGSGDPVLQAAGLRLAGQGLHAGLLAPALVRTYAIRLLGADSAVVAVAVLRELAEPWAALDPLPPGRLAPFLTAEAVLARPGAADAAVVTAARHGHRGLLRQVVDDPELPPGLRRRGMELLGDLAERADIGALTAVAARDPLLFGGPVVTCLRGLHRRGHFPDDVHVPPLLGLALADHTIAPQEVATILFTCRHAMLRVLVDADADDPSWPRRLALLVALAGQGAGELPIGDAITRVLVSAPAPGPFLDAIRALRHVDAEDAVISLLPAAPAAALEALEAIGGDRTVTALREGLGLGGAGGTGSAQGVEGAGVIAPHLRAVRGRALEVLWHLTRDPAQRRALLVRLDPADLPARIAADLGGPDERELALLRSHLDPEEPVAALCTLAAHGSAGTLPAIADLLLRIVAGLAASGGPGAAGPAGQAGESAGERAGERVGEPVVPQEVLDALHGLGSRLHGRRRVRPSCLLDAENAREAGHALVATTALDLLDRPALSAAEQAILLELLLRAPYTGTRTRVHRLLRHRDRHVRGHVIALLARDATGEDAQALSATLIALTGAEDVQTVRQALLALGHAGARWASTAIAACLDHPNMNVKKTAAQVLARAGSPAAVPALLGWLGRHDNPGLRRSLVEALRAVLGDAYPATVLAAAERTEDRRARELLLEGLDRALAAASVLALDDQGSPVAPTLLALVADGRVGLASGKVGELSAALAGHGITPPATPGPAAQSGADPDVRSLTTEGWNPSVALRIARRPGRPDAGRPRELRQPPELRELRPLLGQWLRLAGVRQGSGPADRSAVLRLVLRLCPAPWTTEELAVFSRWTEVLLDGLEGAASGDRDGLLAVLEAVAPTLPAARKPAVADAVRGLRPAPGSRSVLTLLRALDAVPVRADLELALASARLGADPWRAETAVLREAFAVPQPRTSTSQAAAWRSALEAAVRTRNDLEEFRRLNGPEVPGPGSRDRLDLLIDVYACARPEARPALVDWMADIQPLDAPPWTLTETARATAPRPRTVRADDLDQPRSAALRERLLTMLGASAPDHRRTAALALSQWPEPEARIPVLRAFLHGRVDVPPGADLARTLNALDEGELRAEGILHDRVVQAAARLDPQDLEPLVPLLLEWWEHDPPAGSAAAGQALRRVPADVLAQHLGGRIAAGAWGVLDLLRGRPLLRTPALTQACRRLRAEGRDDLAAGLLLVEGPLRHPDDAVRQDAAALAALRDSSRAGTAAAPRPQCRRQLLDQARTGDPELVHRALTRLAEEHRGPDPDRDPALRDLIETLLHHPKPGVRLHAHRTSRAALDRETYLHHTTVLLDDPQPDVVRTAIRTLAHASWAPAIPALTPLLEHSHPAVRRAAAKALTDLGVRALPSLKHAATHARPDKRPLYENLLNHITTTETD
ncbi:HEAT repeat domain-containing protein [Streptomyces vinaceus]|uniref:HEAT repeat domain-containing protein n=1 Tax=Streptomyces vinaceus TaxID=1960 RepID=UPI0036BE9AA9